MVERPSYLHPLDCGGELLPAAFTFPFRYTPHPLCRRAATVVQAELKRMGVEEGKMYGVIVVALDDGDREGEDARTCASLDPKDGFLVEDKGNSLGSGRREGEKMEGKQTGLAFMAAYSGQMNGSYSHPWFVPPVVDYLSPDSYFQREQAEIETIGRQLDERQYSEKHRQQMEELQAITAERDDKIAAAKKAYAEGKAKREQLRKVDIKTEPSSAVQEQARSAELDEQNALLIRESQQQKADVHRAKQWRKAEIEALEAQLREYDIVCQRLADERKSRSEALQQWLFSQFEFLNGQGEQQNLRNLFPARRIPSGAGECCAPKLLQVAYRLGLKPLAMAEFWWGPSTADNFHQSGAFFPACHSKCRPILTHMLRGLNVEPDPAEHYDQAHAPLRIVWQDEYLAVIGKPEGWVSIPGRSDQPSVFDEAHRLWPNAEGSLIVHRLDMDTSGLMVVAKDSRTHRALSIQFERREVEKRYIALLEGVVKSSGSINLPLAPDLEQLPRQRVDHQDGKEALTDYEVLGVETYNGQAVTRVAFHPLTGRTHQLRVHASSVEGLGHPIVGDRLYGHLADRLYLHAEALRFLHPQTGEVMSFEEKAPF